jgi:GDP-4-dehydro-6-deoxy-D-mannose reductase
VPVGNLTPRRDVTDVRDVVRAYRLLVRHGEAGEAYNVCSGRDLAIAELAEQLVALAERPMRLVPDPALQRPVETPVLRGDPAKLHAATGWVPTIPLDRTLADVLTEQRALLGT